MSTADLTWFKSSYSGDAGGQCLEVALEWRKSTYSGDAGGECLEVALDWRKSSHSGDAGGDCLEVALEPAQPTVHIRDSKAKSGPTLAFSLDEWSSFVNLAAKSALQ
ncbi:DUF397 domain-containing protein [Streptomyces sp. N50]|uniref:DUF397 domain-containing protein n=1 Tax=Streptomyces sp. N50 TaxID=3081765 RepID=UPI002962584E|nr:DUF397 domain-containing protein [Streptomyces sp. N50]WOX09146.1 DUF397 domain-containing protein [Streptomyces sp. N50]